MTWLRAAMLLTALLWVGHARAYHDARTPSREESAYQLRSGEWLLGPFELGVGVWRFELTTRVAPWIVGATFRKLMPNLRLGVNVFENRRFALQVAAGLYFVNSRKLVEEPVVSLFLFPIDAVLSWQVAARHTLSVRARYVAATSDADASEKDVTLRGGAVASNAQLHLSWQWRLTRVSALLCTLRYLPYQADPVLHSSLDLDPATSGTLDASVDVQSLQHSLAGNVSGVFAWRHFNLRVGVSYGALFLNGPGLVLPLAYPYPELNFYWRL
jgi:hypothetical protein